jgi:phospholipase C
MPPPAPPSYEAWHADPALSRLAGASTVSTQGEYHEHLVPYRNSAPEQAMLHRPYGLGPRVPLLLVSPWSRGGWVNSQVFDHTSVLRFMEQRFKVMEPNISPWRRAVCGDLTSAFDFTRPDTTTLPELPPMRAAAARAQALAKRTLPLAPVVSMRDAAALQQANPRQARGTRPSRALPYALQVNSTLAPEASALTLAFANTGQAGAVFHVYDRLNLAQMPRRYTVEAGMQLMGSWALGGQALAYDLWVLGPNGFHRHIAGQANAHQAGPRAWPEVDVVYDPGRGRLAVQLRNGGAGGCELVIKPNAYARTKPERCLVAPQQQLLRHLDIRTSGHWYDFSVFMPGAHDGPASSPPLFMRRFAGRMETGAASVSDPV